MWKTEDFSNKRLSGYWMNHPVVRKYLHTIVSGDPSCDWLTWLMHEYFGDANHLSILVLGCGDGWLERAYFRHEKFSRVVGLDISPELICHCRNTALNEHLDRFEYHTADLNTVSDLDGPYDLIIAHSIFHHIKRLDHLFSVLKRTFGPDTLMFLNDYTGPRRFQYGKEQLGIINLFLKSIPEKYRWNPIRKTCVNRIRNYSRIKLLLKDPGEACRSDRIIEILDRHFTRLQTFPYGGSLLFPLLNVIITNFNHTDERAGMILEYLCTAEYLLMTGGRLTADFTVAVLGNKPGEDTSHV